MSTMRVKPMLKTAAGYIDLPHVGRDPFHVAVDRMAELSNRYLPA
jgi:hypothetical protein